MNAFNVQEEEQIEKTVLVIPEVCDYLSSVSHRVGFRKRAYACESQDQHPRFRDRPMYVRKPNKVFARPQISDRCRSAGRSQSSAPKQDAKGTWRWNFRRNFQHTELRRNLGASEFHEKIQHTRLSIHFSSFFEKKCADSPFSSSRGEWEANAAGTATRSAPKSSWW